MRGRYWLLTIPNYEFLPYLPADLSYIKGQLERGEQGFLHWQVLAVFNRDVRLATVRRIFGPAHAELSRSSAANEYVWKEDTRIQGTQFQLGTLPVKRNCKRDWDSVFELAKSGQLLDIQKDILVPHYRTLRSIASDFATTEPMDRSAEIYWGSTGTGKSRRAWDEATMDAYSKDPRSKFWDGYTGQPNVVIDEFRGGIDVAHILRWTDRYPCRVEIKGASVPLKATRFWFTSNKDPREWYPELDDETLQALLRRFTITHFDNFP